MKSQIFMAIGVALVASVLVTGLASTTNAQSNMTWWKHDWWKHDGWKHEYGGYWNHRVMVEATTVMEMMETVMTTVMETATEMAVTENTSRTSLEK